MGASASKKIEHALEKSSTFQKAVAISFEECVALSQHSFPGVCAYQLLDASTKIYEMISLEEDDSISQYREKWLPQPPSQVEVDDTIQKERLFEGGRRTLDLKEFRLFATSLFRDMCLATACHRLALFVPVGSLGVLAAHLTASRLPFVGPMYRASGPLLPGLLLGSVVGAVLSLKFNLG
ncbi:hypothetical protein O6H91_20G019700 [Diphasiastrum complanatum]|uniref:Uncharacterized protein n=1 Tax=Diphasiastrum complanatum TaxID=34168 RepID=A0ACC2AN82_DIPCM|nr:hypothetical protein O6H91_20G019700 [Diphasiastrum complanatum]